MFEEFIDKRYKHAEGLYNANKDKNVTVDGLTIFLSNNYPNMPKEDIDQIVRYYMMIKENKSKEKERVK